MQEVVKWYLTSIHVGRNGSVAKKPYNPIIGEVFHCSWKVPRDNASILVCISPFSSCCYTSVLLSDLCILNLSIICNEINSRMQTISGCNWKVWLLRNYLFSMSDLLPFRRQMMLQRANQIPRNTLQSSFLLNKFHIILQVTS